MTMISERNPVSARSVRAVARWCAACLLMFGLTSMPVHAQRVALDSIARSDSAVVHALYLTDGTRLVGRITAVTADSVRVVSVSATTMVARAAIREVRQYAADELHNGELWPENPHVSRLIFAPTAIALRKGEAYFADFWIFLVNAGYGVTDRFTIGAGMSIIPGLTITDNLLFVIPKYAVLNQPKLKVALGGLFARVGGFSSGSESVGILYGVATVGSRESNLTLGSGWGYVGDRISDKPVLTLGGQHRVARRIALISENWFFPFQNNSSGLVSYGLRLLGEKISVDFAFANPISDGNAFFPGIPLLGFAVKF